MNSETRSSKPEYTLAVEGREYAEHLKATGVHGYTIVEDLVSSIDRLTARIAELEKALDKADEAMAFELGGEPLPTLMIEARAMIAALKGDATP